jgi:hypothetical protein
MGSTARKGVKIDASALHGHLLDYAKTMGKSLGEVCREQAGLFCLDLVKYTRPFKSPGDGLTSEAKTKGMDNVKNSLYHIFRPIGLATKEQIASLGSYDAFKLWEKRNGDSEFSGTKKLRWASFKAKYGGGRPAQYIPPGDTSLLASIHTKLRQGDGHGSLMSYAIQSKEPFGIVAREKDLTQYIKAKQKNVGKLKSAYYFAALLIRSKASVPAWCKNAEGASNAIGENHIDDPMMPNVTVGNKKGKAGTYDSLIKSAISYRAYAMRVKMSAELNKKKIPLWLATAQGMTSHSAKYF